RPPPGQPPDHGAAANAKVIIHEPPTEARDTVPRKIADKRPEDSRTAHSLPSWARTRTSLA
ncbi:MAG TPA: hypothetical protein VGO16_08040, partial [Pseudonocardiaceae bacterium]|nr:hypothetical protein [Pseudonocardiaceae bacterium]